MQLEPLSDDCGSMVGAVSTYRDCCCDLSLCRSTKDTDSSFPLTSTSTCKRLSTVYLQECEFIILWVDCGLFEG